MVKQDVDVLIIGGHCVGALLALGLQHFGLHPLLVEAKALSILTSQHNDGRTLALSSATAAILQRLDVWQVLQPHTTAVKRIHVSQQGAFGSTCIDGNAQHALGYISEMSSLMGVLHQRLDPAYTRAATQLVALDHVSKTVTLQAAEQTITIKPKLLVAADGVQSTVRTLCDKHAQVKDYGQLAIVANVGMSRAHAGTAFERFTADGVLALLPLSQQRASLVWVVPTAQGRLLLQLDDHGFLQQLQHIFGYRLGRLQYVSKRSAFPLQQVVMTEPVVDDWILFMGNAEHALHPIAAQGFNLSVRDVAALLECILKMGYGRDMLLHYQNMRKHDKISTINLINGLLMIFGSRLPGSRFIKGAGLWMMDEIPFLKNLFARYAQGLGGVSSDLICGIPLSKKDHL